MTRATPSTPLVIYGAGGHGQVVADTARALGIQVLGFVDDAADPAATPAGPPILSANAPQLATASFIVAIGDNLTRKRVLASLIHAGRPLTTLIHPTACVSDSAALGQGVWVGPRAIVHTQASVGDGAIINSGAIVEHHNVIHPFAHVAPGAVLGGNVTVGESSLVGLGARVLPGVRIGADCAVGAGSVVVDHAADGATVVGAPARPV